MSRMDKLRSRLFSRPSDFTWDELTKLLGGYGFELYKNKGSRRKFIHAEPSVMINLHEPHPDKVLKRYVINQVIEKLEELEEFRCE